MKRAVVIIFIFVIALACKREERGFRVQTPDANRINSKQLTTLQAGEISPTPAVQNEYENNAYALSEGKRLYQQMNCVGCHLHGGGGIGPPLMDDEWIYGSRPEQIFATIAEGRPNGMPAWKYMLSTQQIWQLTVYVRSLSGMNPKGARSGRDDHMMGKPSEMQTPNAKPKNTTLPPPAVSP